MCIWGRGNEDLFRRIIMLFVPFTIKLFTTIVVGIYTERVLFGINEVVKYLIRCDIKNI